MATTSVSTRRSFISIAGAALSAPLAAAGTALPVSAAGPDDAVARLAMLEDLNAIRALTQTYVRHLNAGAHQDLAALFAEPANAHVDPQVRGIAADGFGNSDAIELAEDRQTATVRLHGTVHTETVIGPTCPLVEMAREQGGGVIRGAEPGALEHVCVKHEGVWKIRNSHLHR